MALVTVGLGGTHLINQDETDAITFLGLGTLDIAGTAVAPIDVTLSQVAGIGLLDTITVTNANVMLNGVAGVSALTSLLIGGGGRLELSNTANIAVGTTVAFTASSGHLVLDSGVNLSLLSGISGFGPGNSIDVGPVATALAYADAPGANTGGVLTLLNGSNPVDAIQFSSGDFSTTSFKLSSDGIGGSLIDFETAVTAVTALPAVADLGIGQTTTLTLAISQPVSVTGGIPSLTLSDGGTAIYDPGASTPTALAFAYTVAAGQNAADLAISAVALNGAAMTDAAGNPVNLADAAVNPAGILRIDGMAPTVTDLTASPSTGDTGAGQAITFNLGISEPVTVAGGTPTLALSSGGTGAFDAGASTPQNLVFIYMVAPGQNTADLAVTAASLNGATITDGAGNAADLSGATGNPAGILQVDTTAPTVIGVAASPSTASGQVVGITLDTSEPVIVSGGTPTLALSNGGTATYDPASSTPTGLAFTYTVGAGQSTAGMAVTASNLNGATITDGAGNAADLTGAVGPLPAPSVPNNFRILDTTTDASFEAPGDNYNGPVANLQHQYITTTPDNVNIVALTPNVFIHSGSGTDAIDVSKTNGTNVLDGSVGSNFLVGGTGMDTFFVDDRTATSDIWSTVSNFHPNDAVTLYGITPTGFAFDWEDNQGAAGYTGLTLHAIAAGKPIASMTIAGYSTSDLSNGRLTVSFGTDQASQSNYLYIHGA